MAYKVRSRYSLPTVRASTYAYPMRERRIMMPEGCVQVLERRVTLAREGPGYPSTTPRTVLLCRHLPPPHTSKATAAQNC